MRQSHFTLVALVALALGTPSSAQDAKPRTAGGELATLKDKVSYSIGLGFGKNIKEQEIDVDPELLIQGVRDAIAGANPRLTDEQIEQCMTEFRAVFIAQQEAKEKAASELNKKKGEAFLAQNKDKPGVKTTATGLQYQIVEEGKGASPKATDTVRVHYRGTLIDGTEFDSSYKRNQPATFPLNGVIKGWTEGLQFAKPGGKLRLFIPSELAYGENSPPGSPIGPNSVLVFDIELLEVMK